MQNKNKPQKISIRFYEDKEVRAVWNDERNTWVFSVVDIIGILTESKNPRNYWKYLKNKLKSENPQLVSSTIQLKLLARDGKRYLTDCIEQIDIIHLAEATRSKKSANFIKWLVYSEETIDGQSKKKAYDLFESGLLNTIDAGSIKSLQQIHSYIFGGLYDFAGQIRTINIAKDGYTFAPFQHFYITLPSIENMPENSFDEIVDKYVEMNVAHPFMEGNGRTTRIWLDLILTRSLKKCVNWSVINKNEYLAAMKKSVDDSNDIRVLLKNALTSEINNREVFMKGIDYSYYYEQED